MHVFVTGGTGLIGSAVVAELARQAATRSWRSRARMPRRQAAEAAGATPLRGSLADLDVLRAGAAQAEGVIHLAFANDFSSAEALQNAVAEESAALTDTRRGAGRQRPAARHRRGHAERAGPPLHRGGPVEHRRPGRRPGPRGHVGAGTRTARRPRIGDQVAAHGPQQRHRRLRRPVDEHRPPERRLRLSGRRRPALASRARARRGGAFSASRSSGRRPAPLGMPSPTKATWCARSHRLSADGSDCRSTSLPVESYGPLGAIFAADQPASSAYTRKALGWEPKHPSLLEDLENIQP